MPHAPLRSVAAAGLLAASGIARQADVETRELTVVTVDGRTDEPLAGVRVVWTAVPDTAPWAPARRPGIREAQQWEPALLEHPRGRATTDAGGRATLSLEGDRHVVAAYDDGRWGAAFLWTVTLGEGELAWNGYVDAGPELGFAGRGEGDDRCTLRLYPDFDLEVATLAPDGSPAGGVAVRLGSRWTTGDSDRLLATSDDDGRALLRHAGHAIARAADSARRREVDPAPWFVALDLCTDDGTHRPIDVGSPPDGPLRLTLPPTGTVEVRVVDGEGRPVEPDGEVTLCPGPWVGLGAEFGHTNPRLRSAGSVTRPAPQGVASFPHVVLGQELVAEVFVRERRWVGTFVAFTGPRIPGEELVCEVPVGPGGPVLQGRLVHADGTPVRKIFIAEVHEALPEDLTEWERSFHQHVSPRQQALVRSDADGRFTLELEGGGGIPARPLLVLERARDRPDTEGAVLDLAGLRRGVHELGDVVVTPAPVLVAGSVRDEDGSPVGGARVCVYPSKGTPRFSPTTDERGRFVIRTHVPYPMVTVDAEKPGHGRCSARDLAPGTEDVELGLVHAGDLTIELDLPRGLRPGDVSLGIRMKEWDGRWGSGSPDSWGAPGDDGIQTFRNRHPGVYEVVIELPRGYRLAKHPPLEARVVAGEETVLGTIRVVEGDR